MYFRDVIPVHTGITGLTDYPFWLLPFDLKKTMKQLVTWSIAVCALTLIVGCKKQKKEPETAQTDTVTFQVKHLWKDSLSFELNTDFVNPLTNDTVNFTNMRYYLSNIRLKKADGSWWVQPESYFLLNLENNINPSIQLENVPYGEYTEVSYVLGVDSLRNVSGAQTGDLSPALGMFWTWSSGYIMLKAEGISPNSSSGSFAYHLGGFYGTNNIVSTKSQAFGGNSLSVTGNGQCKVIVTAKPEKLWETFGSVSGGSVVHTPGTDAKKLAKGFYNSFQFKEIHE